MKIGGRKFIKYIKSRKPPREVTGQLDDKDVEVALRVDKAIAGKPNDFSPLVFTAEEAEIPIADACFVADRSEMRGEFEANIQEVLDQIIKLKVNKPPGPNVICM